MFFAKRINTLKSLKFLSVFVFLTIVITPKLIEADDIEKILNMKSIDAYCSTGDTIILSCFVPERSRLKGSQDLFYADSINNISLDDTVMCSVRKFYVQDFDVGSRLRIQGIIDTLTVGCNHGCQQPIHRIVFFHPFEVLYPKKLPLIRKN